MRELIARVEELAVQASRDARQIETLQGLLNASQSDLMAELTDAIERKKKIDQLASENSALIVSECGHKKAAREAQEKYEESHRLHSLAVEARNNAQEEVRKLRAEVPLESTREGLKNAVAKLQEVTTDRDRLQNELAAIYAEAKAYREAIQKKDTEIQEWLMQLANARNERDAAITRADNIATCRDRWMKIAADCGRMDGEDAGEFMARLAERAEHGVDLAVKVEELRVAVIESEAALERLRHADDQNTKAIANLSVELSARYAEIAKLHKWATGLIENPGFAQNAPERTMQYREIVERINSRPQLDLTAMLPVVDWQAICTRLNAKVGPLEKLYEVVKKHVDHGAIIDNRADIYDAVAETAKALSQLTA